MTDHGVMFISSGEPYLSEATRSARSVRQQHPEMPIVLFAPDGVDAPTVFDDVLDLGDPNHDFSDSNLTSDRIPFDRTLFLDTDTYVCGSLKPLFETLDEHDLAAAHDPTRNGTVDHQHDHNVPSSYPQFNTGVLAFRDVDVVHRLFDHWNELYGQLEGVQFGLNQPAFRIAAYESDADIATVPPEFNYRWGMTGNRVGYASGEIRILHGRSSNWDVDSLARRLNSTTDRRTIVIGESSAQMITHEEAVTHNSASELVERAYWKRQKDGLSGLAKGVVRTIAGGQA